MWFENISLVREEIRLENDRLLMLELFKHMKEVVSWGDSERDQETVLGCTITDPEAIDFIEDINKLLPSGIEVWYLDDSHLFINSPMKKLVALFDAQYKTDVFSQVYNEKRLDEIKLMRLLARSVKPLNSQQCCINITEVIMIFDEPKIILDKLWLLGVESNPKWEPVDGRYIINVNSARLKQLVEERFSEVADEESIVEAYYNSRYNAQNRLFI